MRIVITNDDGISSNGIKTLAKRLSEKHEVLVVAPHKNRSACSQSLTIGKPLRCVRESSYNFCEAYSFEGTPSDCVKFAMTHFKDFKADLVVSGINKGSNLGHDVMYSGTVAAALEALYYEKQSIAVSSVARTNNNFDVCADVVFDYLDELVNLNYKGIVWNINVPNIKKEEIKGHLWTKLGIQVYSDNFEPYEEFDDYFVLGGEVLDSGNQDVDTDVQAVKNGYVSISPLTVDRTNHYILEVLKKELK